MKKVLLSITFSLVFCGFVFAQNTPKTNEKSDANNSALKDRPLKILHKPRAAYPKSDTGTFCFQGTVTLRVEFLASSEIGEISVVSGLPYGATESAIEAAKRIKFEPAVKDGSPITVKKVVEFSFSIY